MQVVGVQTVGMRIAIACCCAIFLSAMAASTANAQCKAYVTHWGRISQSVPQARHMARAGMNWKVRNRMGDTVRLARGIRIDQCKPRDYGWQCQASVVVDRCF